MDAREHRAQLHWDEMTFAALLERLEIDPKENHYTEAFETINRLEAEVERLMQLPKEFWVDPKYIEAQRELGWPDIHPEDYCHKCGCRNQDWAAPYEEWIIATHRWAKETDREGICCINCYQEMYEEATGHSATLIVMSMKYAKRKWWLDLIRLTRSMWYWRMRRFLKMPEPEYMEPCRGCGGTEMPLHIDYMCPNCHILDDEVDGK